MLSDPKKFPLAPFAPGGAPLFFLSEALDGSSKHQSFRYPNDVNRGALCNYSAHEMLPTVTRLFLLSVEAFGRA